MKNKVKLLIPFLVFGVTGCSESSYSTPKKITKMFEASKFQDFEKISYDEAQYAINSALTQFGNVSSYEKVEYEKDSYANYVKTAKKDYLTKLAEIDDNEDYDYEKVTIYEDNVIGGTYESSTYWKNHSFFSYSEKGSFLYYAKDNENNENSYDAVWNTSLKYKSDSEKYKLDSTFITEEYGARARRDKFAEDYIYERFTRYNSLFDNDADDTVFCKDKKGNIHVVFLYSYTSGTSDLLGNYHDDGWHGGGINEFVFSKDKNSGIYHVDKALYCTKTSYLYDALGNKADEPIVIAEYNHLMTFEYGAKKAASKHAKAEPYDIIENYQSLGLKAVDEETKEIGATAVSLGGYNYDKHPYYYYTTGTLFNGLYCLDELYSDIEGILKFELKTATPGIVSVDEEGYLTATQDGVYGFVLEIDPETEVFTLTINFLYFVY